MKYIGVKIIEAESMSEASFINNVKNEDVPQDCLCRYGYKVTYEDGYVSWSPEEVFEKAYAPILKSESEKKTIVIDLNTGNWLDLTELKMREDVALIRESIAVLNETFKAFSQVIPESECKQIVNKIFELVEKL